MNWHREGLFIMLGSGKFFTLSFILLLITIPPKTAGIVDESGAIRGEVIITRDDRDELMGRQRIADRYPSRSTRSPETRRPIKPERYKLPQKSVIYLEAEEPAHTAIAPSSSNRVILDQRDLMFYPHVLAIEQGTTVIFPNNDDVFHNVFSYSNAKQFDLGRYPKGQFRTVTFDTPGVIRLFCDIHAHMNAVILVLDNPYFTSPDDTGTFSIPDVPSGRYTVHFWYGRNLAESRHIEIKPRSVTKINFVY
jgi:plastocyanin